MLNRNNNIKNKKVYNYKIIIIIIVFLLASFFTVKGNGDKINEIDLFKDTSIINLIGVLFGFSLTVITLIYTNYEKILKILNEQDIEEKYKDCIKEMVQAITKELKEDVLCIFSIMFILIIIISFKYIDIPYLKCYLFSKQQLILVVKITGLMLALFAVWDLLKAVFKLLEVNLLYLDEE